MYPAIALIEVSSLARGFVVTDAVVKKARVRLLASQPLSPGKYITLFDGPVAQVEESYIQGLTVAGDTLVDKLFLPQAHEQLLQVLANEPPNPDVDSLGIVETFTVASTILSADAACKAAHIQLLEVRLGTGLDGKAYYIVTGELHQVEAAVEYGINILDKSLLVRSELIPNPHPDWTQFLW